MRYYIDIEDSSGNRLGSGPITSMGRWRSTAKMDQAGDFAFSMPASDEQADIVAETRVARCYALLPGGWTEIGAGVIERIDTRIDDDGAVTLEVSGPDLLRELTYRSVGKLAIQAGGGAMTHAAAVAAAAAYAPSGWTGTAAGSPACDSLYGQFADESVLAALAAINAKSQTHFYAVGRALIFASAWSSSGVRAVQAQGDLAAETAAIVALSKQRDSWDLITRIVPYGAGDGAAQLTLAATTRTAPTGYTLDTAANVIRNDAAEALYGRRERRVDFKDITPLSSTTADVQAAANMLCDSALRTLALLSAPAEFYSLKLAECSTLLRPLQTVRLVYRDLAQRLDIDADLYILAATVEVDADGLRTTDVQVASVDRWPASDAAAVVEQLSQSKLYQVHPQRNGNLHTIAYTKHVDETEQAEFRFRFDDDVLALSRVTFDFAVLALESTVKTVALEQSTGGMISTSYTGSSGATSSSNSGTPSVADTGNASVATTSGQTGGTTTDSGGSGSTGSGGSSSTDSGGSGSTGSSGSGSTGSGGSGTSGGSGDLETDEPDGTDWSGGSHRHSTRVYDISSPSGAPVYLYQTGGTYYFGAPTGAGSKYIASEFVGNHTHAIDGHTHTVPSHTHTIGDHSHTLAAHSHTIPSHSHTMAAHSHTIPSHSHTLNQHTHNISHTHTISHTHDISHTHTFTPAVTTVYGIFRDSAANTFGLADLEYSVDGVTWFAFAPTVNGYTSLGDGWHRIDITALVMATGTFLPAAANNLLRVRRKATGATGKAATIDAQLNIRSIIQAIDYQ